MNYKRCIVYTIYCIVYTVYYTMPIMVYTIHHTLSFIQYTVNTINMHYTQCTIQSRYSYKQVIYPFYANVIYTICTMCTTSSK